MPLTVSESPPPSRASRDALPWELAAESIAVRIRWFGLIVGWVLVNLPDRAGGNHQAALNAILALGAVYTLLDTWYSARQRVFLGGVPPLISLMEAVFIGLLCHFDSGLDSPFRFYYFLSLLLCAIRYTPAITYATFALHAVSYGTLMFTHRDAGGDDLTHLVFMLVLMGWLSWAGTALAGLIKQAGRRLSELNDRLKENQALLEDRIRERTAELQQSQALLVQQEKQAAFGLLAAGIAHEVGNPLAGISSLVQLLKMRHEDDYTRSRLTMVDDQLRRIQRTLRELVGFSRPASTERSLCDVHEVLDAALNIAKYYKRKKGREIVTRYADDLPRLRLVRDQLVQVFLNLILNALDATDEGGRLEITTGFQGSGVRSQESEGRDQRSEVRGQGSGDEEEPREVLSTEYSVPGTQCSTTHHSPLTTHSASGTPHSALRTPHLEHHSPLTLPPDGEWIRVSIRDDGHGIPESDREAIFQPYYTTKKSGTGLGLFVCRHLLGEAGSGRLELTDTGPHGTTFTVLLKSGERRAKSGEPDPDSGAPPLALSPPLSSGPPLSALGPPHSSTIPRSALRIPHSEYP